MTRNDEVRGLTTAAGLWLAAGLGLALGVGFYRGSLTAPLPPHFISAPRIEMAS